MENFLLLEENKSNILRTTVWIGEGRREDGGEGTIKPTLDWPGTQENHRGPAGGH